MAKIKKDTSLRKAILQAAITGQLISNVDGETETGKQLLDRIIEERNKKLLAEWEEKLKENPKTKKPTQIVASEIDDEDIPFEIPESWCWCRLGDLVPFGECENAEPNEIEDDAWILDLEDIEKDSGRIIQFKKKKEIDSKSTKHIFKEGNVLYSKLRPYLNKCVIAPKDGYCTSEIIPLDFGKFISNKYAQKFLMSPYFVDYTDSLSYGVKMPRLGTTDGKKALIPLPPLAVQNAIVAKLEEVLPFVDAYENVVLQKEELKNALPDKIKKAILQEAIQGKLTESWRKEMLKQVQHDGHTEETGKQLLDRIIEERNAKLLADWEEAKKKNPKAKKPIPIVASEISEEEIPFEIPENWCWCRLGDVFSTMSGLGYKKDVLVEKSEKMIRVLRGGNILDTSYIFKPDDIMISDKYVKPELFLKKNYLITPAVTSLEHIGKIGYVGKDYTDTVVGGFVLMLIPHYHNEILSKYFLYLFGTRWLRDMCKEITHKSGQAFYNLSRDKLLQLQIPLPPLAEQEKIVEIIEQMLPLCEKLGR